MVTFATLYFKASYVNASRIVFANCEQTFLAAQAPKLVSFNHFWHMVVQEKVTNVFSLVFILFQVSVIVMVTKLVEKNKRKAHQYWPEDTGDDSFGDVLDIGGGYSVKFVSTSFQGSYFLRQDKYFLPNSPILQDLLHLASQRGNAKSDPAPRRKLAGPHST